jgi:hypothetical protein
MARLIGAQRLVLQTILKIQRDASNFVEDSQIAQTTRIDPEDVRDWLETLEGEGYVDVAKTAVGLVVSITALGKLVLRQFEPIGKAPSLDVPQSTTAEEYDRQPTQDAAAPGEAGPDADQGVPEEFRVMYRGAARTSISQSDFERFEAVDSLLKTLPSDEVMRANVGRYTPRTQEEDRNVILTCFLYALKKQISGDYSMVIGGAPDGATHGTMMCRIPSVPTRENPTMVFLKSVREKLEQDLFKHMNLDNKIYIYFNPPVPLIIMGSLYYNGLHQPGTMGPARMKSETGWEIGPIISLGVRGD